ncbi:hypothetical protein MLD38_036117 [Melastoma candidum]|uniref:Uncharacterized protein n=1 Tax=Melastoma candidum TaxID=119954 RepID=A0ACB9LIN3_9MYRT|nr:hypothetical protein MLD38_036117 [Melastoma candidum]
MESSPNDRLDYGKMAYGCQHYGRRCKIRAPCCNEVFPCRHCHNGAAAFLGNSSVQHELVRQDVKQVIVAIRSSLYVILDWDSKLLELSTRVGQVCSNYGVRTGEYFCNVCKFYDDDTAKGQFHYDDCCICRVGGRENFFHCKKCGLCYSIVLQNNHSCVENSMRHHCPICFENVGMIFSCKLASGLRHGMLPLRENLDSRLVFAAFRKNPDENIPGFGAEVL